MTVSAGCIAVVEPGQPEARLLLTQPRADSWDLDHIGRFIRHVRPPVRDDLLLAPLRRRGAAWGAMALIHPKDLFYQILDGLRSLTHCDHSSALFIGGQPQSDDLTLLSVGKS